MNMDKSFFKVAILILAINSSQSATLIDALCLESRVSISQNYIDLIGLEYLASILAVFKGALSRVDIEETGKSDLDEVVYMAGSLIEGFSKVLDDIDVACSRKDDKKIKNNSLKKQENQVADDENIKLYKDTCCRLL